MNIKQLDLIRVNELCELTTLKRSTIFKAIKQNMLPRPIKLLGKINAWDRQEIINWLESQRRTSNANGL
ncbi:MAG TPA: AlpA family phage regulatory protein [Burkholderiales bacterium]|nr:AlpA family phage regulatory protein [Burkholderiales bacterium]